MMQFKFTFLILICFIFSSSYSQNSSEVYKKPLCMIDLNFGYAAPAFDFSGSRIKDFYSLTGYGMNTGYNTNFTTKFGIVNFKEGQFRGYFTLAYAQLNGSENRAYNIGAFIKRGWPHSGLQDTSIAYVPPTTDTAGTSSIILYSPFLAFGAEIAFYTDRERKSIINFGMDFNVTTMWGKIYDQPAGKKETYNNFNQNNRLGLGLNLGYSYRVVEMLGLSVATRLQFSNLFYKKSEVVTDDGDLWLDDASDLTVNKFLNQNRSIGFFGIYGGVTFYIGGKK
jgi:hypothetical protein